MRTLPETVHCDYPCSTQNEGHMQLLPQHQQGLPHTGSVLYTACGVAVPAQPTRIQIYLPLGTHRHDLIFLPLLPTLPAALLFFDRISLHPSEVSYSPVAQLIPRAVLGLLFVASMAF